MPIESHGKGMLSISLIVANGVTVRIVTGVCLMSPYIVGNCHYCACELQKDDPQVTIDGKLMCSFCAQAYQDGQSSMLEEQS